MIGKRIIPAMVPSDIVEVFGVVSQLFLTAELDEMGKASP